MDCVFLILHIMILLQVKTFSDIFKKSFLAGWSNQQIGTNVVVVSLLITMAIALYIFFAYRITTRKTFYSKSFNVSLAGVALITAAIILTIQSNIVISLGMVGALSIVRFRTAIKNPMDLMFLFWSISTGIICGAGYPVYAIFLAILLTILIIALNYIPQSRCPMILVLNSTNIECEKQVMSVVKKYSKHSTIKARKMTSNSLDFTIEVSAKGDYAEMMKLLVAIDGVINASLLAHDGEVTF